MLNGFWAIDIADERGARADGLVAFRDGTVLGESSTIDIDGSYEAQDDAILAAFDVVLHGRDPSGERMAERVHLHVQGWLIGAAISASGIDLADKTRRVRIYLEQRAALPACPPARPPSLVPPGSELHAARVGTMPLSEGASVVAPDRHGRN